MNLTEMYREVEALGGAVIMDDYEEGYRDGLDEALAVLRRYGFGVDLAPETKGEIAMIEDGGPAYPAKLRTGRTIFAVRETASAIETVPVDEVNEHPGMSLRDWFAGKALTGVVGTVEGAPIDDEQLGAAIGHIAKMSYRLADAMLAARKAAA